MSLTLKLGKRGRFAKVSHELSVLQADFFDRRFIEMDISRKLGILVFFGVPAVIGGGITYALFGDSYTAVFIYEFLLLLTAGIFVGR